LIIIVLADDDAGYAAEQLLNTAAAGAVA